MTDPPSKQDSNMPKPQHHIPSREKVTTNDCFFSETKFKEAFDNQPHNGSKVITEPFKTVVMDNFLPSPLGTYDLRGELLSVKRKARGTDLMNLEESVVDLTQIEPEHSHTGNIECIQLFCDDMMRIVRPWIQGVTGIPLSSEKMSIRTSMYKDKDHLLCHNDKIEDRKIAFVLYLSKGWKKECGGELDLFSKDDKGRPETVARSIEPIFNRCVFFEVTDYSYHQVREVVGDYERFSVNGWFHAEEEEVGENGVVEREARRSVLLEPSAEEVDLEQWIRKSRLDNQDFIKLINETLENFSFCGIKSFLKQNCHAKLSQDIVSESVKWTRVGPPDERNYEIAEFETLPESLRGFVESFTSTTFCQLLKQYSDLDLVPNSSCTPKLSIELQRWTKGCYTLLYDDESKKRIDEPKNEMENLSDREHLSEEESCSDEVMREDVIGAKYQKVFEEFARPSSSKDVGEDFITNYDGHCVGNPMLKRKDKNSFGEDEEARKPKRMKVEEEDKKDEEDVPGALDVVYYFHVDNAPKDMTLNYVDPQEEEGVCLTLPPQDNTLFIVFRQDGVLRQHEYVDHSCKGYFYSLVCSYHEENVW